MLKQDSIRCAISRICKIRMRASYTIEASFIVPIMLWVMAVAMKAGIALHEEIQYQKEQEGIAKMWQVEDFYAFQTAGEVWND